MSAATTGGEVVEGARRSTGPRLPLPATPPHAPGSVRRTTSIDLARPDGLLGRLVLDVRGRDVRTGRDGRTRSIDELALTIEMDQRSGEATAVSGGDGHGSLSHLVGVDLRSGLGRRLAELLPDQSARRSLAFSALEDLGGALLVSGYALLHAGLLAGSKEQGEQRAHAQADICAGWAAGGPVHDALREQGIALLPIGPSAPGLGDDLAGHHAMAPLEHHTVRRRRRLDVVEGRPGDPALLVQAHFRDSYAADDGELVMHEYVVDAAVDDRDTLVRVDVDARVLPWRACPAAVPSAQRLVGVVVDELPARVRNELVGATTCTHLNSTMRSLADVGSLRSHLAG